VTDAQVETLFDEFATRYLRGEHPDVREYLERAGAERDSLGALLDRFLEAVPAREPSEEDVVLIQARLEHEAPLLVLRKRRKLGRGAVVDALVQALRLEPEKREKVAGYYHELETGLLDPEPVDSSVWEALSDLLHANARALAGLGPLPPAAAPAFHRFDADFVLAERSVPPVPRDECPDEVDRLFTGTS
jgi:hypothetical protein